MYVFWSFFHHNHQNYHHYYQNYHCNYHYHHWYFFPVIRVKRCFDVRKKEDQVARIGGWGVLLIWAMPESKRLFFTDPFPKSFVLILEHYRYVVHLQRWIFNSHPCPLNDQWLHSTPGSWTLLAQRRDYWCKSLIPGSVIALPVQGWHLLEAACILPSNHSGKTLAVATVTLTTSTYWYFALLSIKQPLRKAVFVVDQNPFIT